MEITPRVHLIPASVSNAFLIVEDEGLTLIDAGFSRSAGPIFDYLEQQGFSPADIKRVLITHTDLDHVGGLVAIKKASGAAVAASRLEAEALAKGESSRPLKARGLMKLLTSISAFFVRFRPVAADEILAPGQVLPILGGLEVIPSPGHTPEHISFFARRDGILFAGDSLRAPEGKLRVSSGMNTWDEEQARASARKQAALRPRIVCVGHGPVVFDAQAIIPG